MSKIRSIADEIRDRIRSAGEAAEPVAPDAAAHLADLPLDTSAEPLDDERVRLLFEQLSAFRMQGSVKMVIRLDAESIRLLKQLKFTRDIDMTKVVVFAFHQFLREHSWLREYVLELLKSQNYEME